MRGLRILLFVVLPVSFVFGLAWGWKVRRDREARGTQAASVKVVRILSLPHLVPRAALTDFETSALLEVEVTEVSSPTELVAKWTEMKARDLEPDLVTLLYTQIPETSKALKIQPFNESLLTNFGRISKDFLDWPQSHEWPTTAPLAWGIDGWSQRPPYKPTTEKKLLWVATLAMTSGCSNPQEAHAVADFLISGPAAIARVVESRLPSTSLETEAAPEVAEELKPSMLRRVPLTDYVIKEPERE
jgi:spermidine/putrescine-binding protein